MSEFINLQKLIAEDQALHRGDSRFDAGIAFERQRIIKLLNERLDNYGNLGWTVEQTAIKIAIELVKGENK